MTTPTQSYAGHDGGVLRVALAYMVVGFVLFLLMGLLGLLMRLNQGGILTIPPRVHYWVLTLHGTGMVAASLLAALGGVAAILSQHVRLSARLLWTILLVYSLGAGFVVLATAVGGFGAGWTILPPLPYHSGGGWDLWAAVAAYTGYLLVAVGFLLYCVHTLYVVARAHGGLRNALAWPCLFSGGKNTTVPLPSPIEMVSVVVSIVGIATVLGGVMLLVPLYAQAIGLVDTVNALFAKNFVFIFGHTLVNLNIYLAAGLVYATLPIYTGRAWKTTWPLALAVNLVMGLVVPPYFHHLYQDFVQPLPLHILGQIASFGVALPAVLVTIIGGLALMYRSGMRWTVPSALIALGLWGWATGGIGAVLDGIIGINQIMHNTLWVPAHFHTYYLLGAVAFAWAYLYHLVVELSGSSRESGRSMAAAWLYGVGGAGFIVMFFVSGAYGVPRRFAVHLPEWRPFAQISVPFIVVLGAGVAWLAVDIFRRLGAAWKATRTSTKP